MNKRQPRGTQNVRNLAVRITERDLLLLQALRKMRFLTTSQIARLFFNGSSWSANKRLRKLFNAGFIKVWVISLSQENIYSITRKGFTVINADLDPNETQKYPRGLDRNLDHLLAINHVRITLALGLPEIGAEISWWWSDWDLRARAKVRVVPDALFSIQWAGKREQIYSLELDHRTESQRAFLIKILRYNSVRQRGNSLYGITEFLLLVVGYDPKWVERYRLSLSDTRLGKKIWFTTLSELQKNGIGNPIWKSVEEDKKYSLPELGFLLYSKEGSISKNSYSTRT